MQSKLLGIINFDAKYQLLVIYCAIFVTKWEAVHQLFIDFKNAYDSVRREVFFNILIEFGIPMELVRLIKTCMD